MADIKVMYANNSTQDILPNYEEIVQLIENPPTYKHVVGVSTDKENIARSKSKKDKKSWFSRNNFKSDKGNKQDESLNNNKKMDSFIKTNICKPVRSIKKQFQPKYNEDELWDNVWITGIRLRNNISEW